MPRRARTGVAAIVASATLMLTGCISAPGPAGGQTASEAVDAITAVPGVASAKVTSDSMLSGFTRRYSTQIKLELEPGYTVGPDEAATLDWALRTAWSVRDQKPDAALQVIFNGPGGAHLGWDPSDATQQLGKKPKERFTGYSSVTVGAEFAEARYGQWPGTPPEAPPNAFVVGPPAE